MTHEDDRTELIRKDAASQVSRSADSEIRDVLDWESICSLRTSDSTGIWAVAAINSDAISTSIDDLHLSNRDSDSWRLSEFARFSSFLPSVRNHHDLGNGDIEMSRNVRVWSRKVVGHSEVTAEWSFGSPGQRTTAAARVSVDSVHHFSAGDSSTVFLVFKVESEALQPFTIREALELTRLIGFRGAGSGMRTSVTSSPPTLAHILAMHIADLAECFGIVPEKRRSQSLLCLYSIHVEDLDHEASARIARALASGYGTDVDPGSKDPIHLIGEKRSGILVRDSEITYVSNYSTAGMLITPTAASSAYIWSSLPAEARTVFLPTFLYAAHQRAALLHLGERLSSVELLDGDPTEVDDNQMRSALASVTKLQSDFEKLIAWTRFRSISPRPGVQQFYDLLSQQLRLEELETEFRTAIGGVANLLTSVITDLTLEQSREEELIRKRLENLTSRLTLYGAPIVVTSLIINVMALADDHPTLAGAIGIAAGTYLLSFIGLLIYGRVNGFDRARRAPKDSRPRRSAT